MKVKKSKPKTSKKISDDCNLPLCAYQMALGEIIEHFIFTKINWSTREPCHDTAWYSEGLYHRVIWTGEEISFETFKDNTFSGEIFYGNYLNYIRDEKKKRMAKAQKKNKYVAY